MLTISAAVTSSEPGLLFWRVAVNTFTFLCVYDIMRIVLLKWNGQMLMKWLSEQFMYLYPHLVRRQTLISQEASRMLQYE